MNGRNKKRTWAVIAAFSLVAAACSSDPVAVVDESAPSEATSLPSEQTTSAGAEDFEDPEALALENGRANVAVELSSSEVGDGEFVLDLVVLTLSDFADLPEVLIEFEGELELVLPLPEQCLVSEDDVVCRIPGATYPEDGAVNLSIGVVPSGEVSVQATVSSLNNPVSNDYDPSDNVDALTISP